MWEQSKVFPGWPPGWSLGAVGKLLRWETHPSRIRAPGKGGRGPLQRVGTCGSPHLGWGGAISGAQISGWLLPIVCPQAVSPESCRPEGLGEAGAWVKGDPRQLT